MISIMEIMVKRTPLNNNKKGMTLVEVMAAMAILLILFGAVSGLLINTAKIEDKSNTLLDNTTYIKAALMMFESKGVTGSTQQYYIDDINFNKYKQKQIIYFDNIEEMQNKIKACDITKEEDKKYKVEISATTTTKNDNITLIEATLINNKRNDNSISKSLYVDRKLN